ncbi:unnamed protein product [Porites evermanni]|uniref:Uncharacterized protein n=1 Tax=Porites evermanni TaxID=104178 RepID=A0ABN8M8I6_9CNID|nr:unnamed protein product [Porites evermanni]
MSTSSSGGKGGARVAQLGSAQPSGRELRQTAEIVNDMTCATVLASLSKHALASSR